MRFYTADEHYFHKNIIEYQNRPFSSVKEMNETLIKNHNSVVGPKDTTYHIGDMVFGSHWMEIVPRLNGSHVLIIGSHDKVTFFLRDMDTSPFVLVENTLEILHKPIIFLSHYAHRRWPKSHYGSWHLYGHNHGNLPDYGLSMDVGVDTNNFFPYSEEEIKCKMENKKVTEYQIFDSRRDRK